ncbi:MAG: glycosyltransferase family 4 protein [Acidobacteria bacterium]|nr:glycosyltransferase family 4 protein [Acidobacteriota bacterium]MCW5971397.1 glycosyltransferase family 4 protein [Blastocatellales bacterium]
MARSSGGKMMHIGIDAHAIGAQQGGNETYIRNLIRALAEIDAENRYTLYFNRIEAAREWTGRFPNFDVRLLPPPTPLIRVPIALAYELRRRPVDVLHVQFTAPPLCPAPVVATIHDLAFEHFPETFTRRGRMQLRLTVRWTARRAARIVTVSEFSRRDLIRTYGLGSERVVVTHNAVEPHFTAQPAHAFEAREIRRRFGIGRDFLLAVGSLQPRKNLVRLLAAYENLRSAWGDAPPQLVLVGRPLWLYRDIFAQIGRKAWAGDVIATGYVGDEELAALYRAALLFVYPSLFEGFGLPPLEAMACGAPVVTSNTSSLPEVVGDAALLVDPADERAIAEAMLAGARNQALREKLRAAGLQRVQHFSWRTTAERTLEVYGEAASTS